MVCFSPLRRVCILRYYRSELPLAGEGWGGEEDELAEALIRHAAEDALVQLRRFVRCGHDGWEFGVIAIVD